MAHHSIISSQLEEIQQFKEGLSSNGVLQALVRTPSESREYFSFDFTSVSANKLKSLITPSFSSNMMEMSLEEDIIYNFHNFIDEIDQGILPGIKIYTLIDLEDGNEVQNFKKLKMTDLLMYLTGSKYVSSSLKCITVYFNHSTSGHALTTTCDPSIRFPVVSRYTGDEFSAHMKEDIFNSIGFGFA